MLPREEFYVVVLFICFCSAMEPRASLPQVSKRSTTELQPSGEAPMPGETLPRGTW